MNYWVERGKLRRHLLFSVMDWVTGNPTSCSVKQSKGRVAVSDSQVVYADHNDRVQDNDLTKEHDFFLGTLGAE